MGKRPQPAGAELHRQNPDGGSPAEQEAAPTQPAPQSGGGGGGGGALPSLGVSNKTLLILGVAAAVALVIYFTMRSSGGSSARTLEEQFDPDAPEDEPARPNIKRPKDDPLAADEEAIEWLKGNRDDSPDVVGSDD